MQRVGSMVLAASVLLGSSSVFAETGDWMVRVRGVNVDWANKSDPVAALAVPADAIHVEKKVIPEIDISYFYTKNIAIELIATYPQKHTVHVTQSAAGAFDAGSLKELPPTVTVQYHFTPEAQFRPYVGAGVNYTRLMKVDLTPLNNVSGGNNTLGRDSFGGALQAGFDFKIGENSYINVDVKKLYIKTDLTNSAAGKLSTLTLDPVLIGVGYGFKFR